MKPNPDSNPSRKEQTAALSLAALKVLESRYLSRDAGGALIETPHQMFERVARALAEVEAKWVGSAKRKATVERYTRAFYELMSTLRFLPNSPTLINAGKRKAQLSACFVLPIDDDLGHVFETLRDAVLVHKTGGGTGFNFGKLRPAGDRVSCTGGVASGPLAFLRIYDSTTQTVKQGGVRRGANMAILPISHPDIEGFIQCKLEGGIENFNISVGITDDFMRAVETGSSWKLINPRTRLATKEVKARFLWAMIAKSAWACGDPGVVFLDRINESNPTPALGRMESTNPCGEQPLLPYESCNLGSMNLLAYLDGDDLAWEKLERDIETAVRFLDNVVETNSYPLLAIEEVTLFNRKIGLGVMGWADVLMEWGIAYDSDFAVRRGTEIMQRINRIAVRASESLAKERGAFPGFSKSMWAKMGCAPRRNATVTTVAPTGTISIIAGVSSGIEPVFSLVHERRALEGKSFVFIHPALRKAFQKFEIKTRRDLERVLESGSVSQVAALPKDSKRVLRTAGEIKPEWHVRMQAVFQGSTENGVSKTINLPSSARVSDVQEIYDLAYKLGCKGITVFRDQSKTAQVLNRGLKSGSARAELFKSLKRSLSIAEKK